LVGSGQLAAGSPLRFGLTQTNGFQPGVEPGSADRLRLWLGDTDGGGNGYRYLHLRSLPGGAGWVDDNGPALNVLDKSELLQPGRAWFVIPQSAHPGHLVSPP
jgi:hypothetical protein